MIKKLLNKLLNLFPSPRKEQNTYVHKHVVVIDPGKEPTCLVPGLTEGEHCALCKEVLKPQREIPALGHTPIIDPGIAPTCTEEGMTEGEHCSGCGEILKPQKVVPALGHTPVRDKEKPAACTKEGLTEGEHCSVCGAVLKAQKIIPAFGHQVILVPGRAPTCTSAGLTDGEVCQVCKEVRKPQSIIPPLGHTVVLDIKIEPTCSSSGLTEGSHCSICRKILKPQKRIMPLAHTPVIDHGKEPTCTLTGLTAGVHCFVCGTIIQPQEEIPALGHRVEKDEGREPTCTKAGVTSGEHCSVCGAVIKEQEEIPALGHTGVVDEAVEPGCTTSGLTAGEHCSVCGMVLKKQEVIPELGHHFIKEPGKTPTCTEEGSTEEERCSVCGFVKTPGRILPAIGHRIVIDPALSPTKSTPGLTQGTHCEICGKVILPQRVLPVLEDSPDRDAEGSEALDSDSKEEPDFVLSPEEDEVIQEEGHIFPELLSLAQQERLKKLTGDKRKYYPLSMVLALGASESDLEALNKEAEKGGRTFPTLEHLNNGSLDSLSWLEALEEDAWKKGLAMCDALESIRYVHSRGIRIANLEMEGYGLIRIANELSTMTKSVKSSYMDYKKAVDALLKTHVQAFDFLYSGQALDNRLAELFFGISSYERICYVSNPSRLLARYGDDGVVGLQASLTKEASNRRTKVLTSWEHLKNYLAEQFDTQPILGSIELDDQEYDLLLKYLRNMYGNNISLRRRGWTDKILCVGLVQIAIRSTNQGFWAEVSAKLNGIQKQRMGEYFISTMKYYRKATYSTSKYVDSIKLHAFVCNSYIDRFYDFLFSYYELDLGRNIENADVEELRQLIIQKKGLVRDYMLLQQTVDALTLIPEPTMARLKTYLNWIDEAFWHQGWLPEQTDRFSRAFKSWCAQKSEFNGLWIPGEREKRHSKRMFTSPTLLLDLGEGTVKLLLPVQRLCEGCGDTAFWRVAFGEEAPRVVESELTVTFSGFLTQERKLSLPKDRCFSSVRIELLSDTEVIRQFSIQEDQVRIFSDQGSLMGRNHLPAQSVYFLTPHGVRVETESEGNEGELPFFDLKQVTLEKGEKVIFPDDTLTIAGMNSIQEGMCGQGLVEEARAVEMDTGRCYPIYREAPFFLLSLSEEGLSKTRIQVNDGFYSLSEVELRCLYLDDYGLEKRYMITLPQPKEELCFYHVHISSPGDHHVWDWNYCHWKDFSFSFENGPAGLPFWNNPHGSVRIDSHISFTGQGVEKSSDQAGEYGFEIDPQKAQLELSFFHGGKALGLVLPLPLLCLRAPGKDWSDSPLGEMWLSDLPDGLDIRSPYDKLTLFVDKDGYQQEHRIEYTRREGEDFIRCDLIPLRSWLGRDKHLHTLHLKTPQASFDLATIYCRGFLRSSRLEALENYTVLHGVFDIFGNGSYCLSLEREGKKVAEQVPIRNGECTVSMELKSGEYTVTVYEETEDEFGFEVTFDEIGKATLRILNPKDLTYSLFQLESLTSLYGKAVNHSLDKSKNYVTLLEKEESLPGIYHGYLSRQPSWKEDGIRVRVQFKSTSQIDQCTLAFEEDQDWLSFLYDHQECQLVREEPVSMPYASRYLRYSLLDLEDTFQIVYVSR